MSDGVTGAPGSEAALLIAFREEWSQVLATLIRTTGDWDLAEDATQEAFARAAATWPRDGTPSRPGAWLTTTARNWAMTRMARARLEAVKLEEASVLTPSGQVDGPAHESGVEDDRLRLVFTCCHPALPMEARVALTLRALGGLTTPEIARALLVSETAMAARITRAKKRIRHTGIPYRVPPAERLAERVPGVLAVLYLVFNEGYATAAGREVVRADLTGEAIRLTRLVVRLLPDQAEAAGLLALMLLHDARRASRTDAAGEAVALEEQDRSGWDRRLVDEGVGLVDRAWLGGPPGPYAIQAAIAACHATAAAWAETDWVAIEAFYRRLALVQPGQVVELNRIVAVSMADGPDAALPLIDALAADGALDTYYLLPATRADLLRRLGRNQEAAAAYRLAIDLAPEGPPARFLLRRLDEVSR